jgi:uncharacterized C2H2 Zn-finger protein
LQELRCPKCGGGELRGIGENHYLCLGCGEDFYACPVCGRVFKKQQGLAGHMSRRHPDLQLQLLTREVRGLRSLLEEVLAALEEVQAGQKLVLSRLDQVLSLLAVEPRRPERPAQAPADLPEFARDNPWLGILARRGGEGA